MLTAPACLPGSCRPRPRPRPRLQTTFLRPFSAGLWFTIIGFLLLAGICVYFVEAPYPGSEFNR